MWRGVKLGDILQTGAGGTPLKSKKEFYEGGDIKWLLSGAVCERDIHDSKTYITQAGLENLSAKVFPKNTVLIAMYGATAGQVGILRTEAATNQAVCGIYPSNDYLPDFLYYYLTNYKETLLLEVSGVAQPNLSQIKIKNIPLPVMTLAEQQRIVSKLDAAFVEINGAIEMSRTAKRSALNLVNATVQDALSNAKFGWQLHKLEDISENLDSKRIPVTKSLRVVGNTPYYGASGIVDYVDGYIFDEDLLLISEDGANLLMRTYPIAFSVSGKTWVNNHAHVLRFSDSETQKWVKLYLNTIDLSEFISGMAQPKLNQKKLNEIPIPLPSKLTFTDVLNLVNTSKISGEKLSAVNMAKEVLWENLKSAILAQELQPSEAS